MQPAELILPGRSRQIGDTDPLRRVGLRLRECEPVLKSRAPHIPNLYGFGIDLAALVVDEDNRRGEKRLSKTYLMPLV